MNATIPQFSAPRRGWNPKLAGAAVLMAASCLCAQDLPYSSGSTGADGPLDIPIPISARSNHAAAFHEGVGKLMVFGGYVSGIGTANDTVIRNTPHWASSNPLGSPPVRDGHAMVYDAARQQIVLFGGGSAYFNDTWVWNGATWTQKSPATSPPGRSDHNLTYDAARQKVVLFGGRNSEGLLNDTWEWDGTNWAAVNPTAKPPARYLHAMAYDENRQRTLVFGGVSNTALNDTWEWDGAAWEERNLTTKPSVRWGVRMAYDRARQEIVLFGGYSNNGPNSETWTYSAGGWVQKSPANVPDARYNHAMAYDPLLQKVVMVAGYSNSVGPLSSSWLWNGSDWTKESETSFTFDMTSRNDGVWNFTTINVPGGVTVKFKKNLTNKPVQWLASGNVTITGTLNLDGESGRSYTNVESGNEAIGGPGGYNGGLGGRIFAISGSYIGSAGGGPGGGAPAIQNQSGGAGTYTGVYGNTFIQPLIGGSGGGGGASSDNYNGGNGGGGGGAILIASSGDLRVDGAIFARGGSGGYSNSGYYGGYGSGGAIRLIADRVLGGGALSATGNGTNGDGRIRVEGYYRPLAASSVGPTPSAGPPTETFAGLGAGLDLTIASVKGTNVRQPPLGDTANPDVIFTEAGVVTITVAGTNIPNGTPVTLRLATSAGVQVLPAEGSPAITMTGNSASFTATVPAGVGTLQAYATVAATP